MRILGLFLANKKPWEVQMRLFCRKCDKEIKDFVLKRGHSKNEPLWYFDVIIKCHGKEFTQRQYSFLPYFDSSDYGDLYFFKHAMD